MAQIDGYLQAIMNAVKGEEVRGSIHDAIEAINDENIELNADIRASVEEIVTEAIEDSPTIDTKIETTVAETIDDYIPQPLIFTYNPRSYLDNFAHIDETMTEEDIMSKESIVLRWISRAGVTTLYEANLVCIGKYSNVAVLGYHSCLYFYNTNDGQLIQILINRTDSAFDIATFDIGTGGSGGGETYTEGYGIDINNNQISVDTAIIQEKLTAGEGISITNGVISVNYDNGDTEVY